MPPELPFYYSTTLFLVKAQPFLVILQEQKTPLHVACEKGHADVTEYLLAHDASMETKDNAGNTPLHVAAQNQQTRIVQLLLDSGADPDPENAVSEQINVMLLIE